ncbi:MULTISPECIES: DUF177 domain-containing protein [Clostridium]|uniref:DUF177 domain-containing protein n=1 Tax=Clostridium cibarium TaxID=2762247 RepID=A0ABR8PQI5_9CLOT|nr:MULTISPECIES: DUF177 domain-containing protein [Clostridium]MBD7910418.1 DUF177 domain-containing protein [Clostridium cibarium]
MKIQFSDLISKRERRKSISYKFSLEPFYFEGDKIRPISEIEVDGVAISDNEIVVIKAHINVQLELICSRCLEAFIYPVDIDIEERFTTDINLREEEEITFVDDDVLDITEIVESSIISTLPIKRLCRKDCKGLCQSCGINLNKETCNCSSDDYDPRLEGLRALLNNKEV